MKKLKLKNLNLNQDEMLTRKQLQKVLGGNTITSSGSHCYPACYCSSNPYYAEEFGGSVCNSDTQATQECQSLISCSDGSDVKGYCRGLCNL